MSFRPLLAVSVCTSLLAGLAGCGATPSAQIDEGSLRATIQAEVRATDAAQAQQQREANLQATNAALQATIDAQQAPTTISSATSVMATSASIVATAQPTTLATAATAPTAASAATSTASGSAGDDARVFQPNAATPQQVANIELVFDASGSMAEDAGGGETRITAARRAIEQIIASLPDGQQNLNVGFRVFGHKGNNTDAGKAESCASTDLYVPMQGVNKDALRSQASVYKPTGWTPISLALQKAGEDLQKGDNIKNTIIMVTDGEETCNGDPCAVSAALAKSGAQVQINVVGFGLTPDVAGTLKCIGDNTGGSYTDAQNGDALVQSLQQLIQSTIQRAYLRVVSLNPDGSLMNPKQIYLNVYDSQGKDQNRAVLSDDNLENSSVGQNAVLGVQPGIYTVKAVINKAYPDYFLIDPIVYTATVETGKETQVTVGLGGLLLKDAGIPAEAREQLRVERLENGGWKTFIETYATRFDRLYDMTPGHFRVVDTMTKQVLGSEFSIVPGKTVTLQLGG